MLVNGWMIYGALHSSYAYTMGLSVSAQGKDCTTRNRVTPPLQYLVKSITYLIYLRYGGKLPPGGCYG